MIHEWQALLERNSTAWGIPGNGKQWTFFLHNNYQCHYSNIHVFWFQKKHYPTVVTKAFPEPALPKQEFFNLQQAYACAPEWIPRPFGLYPLGKFWTIWMAGVPGKRLRLSDLSNASVDRLCETLASIQKELADRRAPSASRFENCVSAPLQTVTEKFTATALLGRCAQLGDQYTEGWLQKLQRLPQHGDLFSGNIMVDGGSWKILDWEALGQVDLPFYDLLCLLFSLEPAMPPGWSPALQQYAARAISKYSAACGLEPELLTSLLPLLLANWAHVLISAERKAAAIAALQDYFSHPLEWERALISAR